MKQLLLLIWFICAFQYSFAEVDDSNVVHDLTSIVIRQKFEGSGHCMPEFDNSKVYINPESDAFELLISSANNENNKIDSVTYEYDFGKKEKTFKKGDKTISQIVIKSHVKEIKNDKDQEFIFDMKLGLNLKTKGASDPCYNWFNDFAGGHRNSYSIQTTFICDVPIPVKVLNSDNSSHLNIDKNECLELQLGEYYEKGNTRIRYKVNGTDKWETIYKNVEIAQNKSIELRYQDIVGPYGSADFIANIGKIITIRVEKQLQDGTGRWTYNKDVECRFYSQGPDFDIVDIHRTACDTEPLSIKINIVNVELFKLFIDNDSICWNLLHDSNARDKDSINTGAPAFRLDKCESTNDPNVFVLYGNNGSDELSDYLNDPKKNATQGWWCLQLVSLAPSLQSFISTKKPFKLSPKPAPITAQQVPNPDSTASPTDPVIYLDIKDTTPYRLPYSIYAYDKLGSIQNSGEPICEFNVVKENGEGSYSNLKEKFNDTLPKYSFEITRGDYMDSYFHDWYNSQSNMMRSTIILGKSAGNEPTSNNWELSRFTYFNQGYNVVLKTTHGGFNYLAKFHVYYDGRCDDACYFKIKGDVAPDIDNIFNQINNHNYYLKYDTDKGLKLIHEENVLGSYGNIDRTESTEISLSNKIGNAVEFIAKGNGYYLAEMLEGGTGYLTLIDMNSFSSVSINNKNGTSFKLSGFGTYGDPRKYNSEYYIVNKDLIVFKDPQGKLTVWHDGEFVDIYTLNATTPNIYSFKDYENGKGYTYEMGGKIYARYYSPLQEKEMYDIVNDIYSVSEKEIIGYDKEDAKNKWEKFIQDRISEWNKFLRGQLKKYYEVTNIPFKDFLLKSTTVTPAYSGYVKVMDSDGCYSDTINYTYFYDDFTFDVEVTNYPKKVGDKTGVVKLTNIKGSHKPYTYLAKTVNAGMVVSGLMYGDTTLTFISKTNDTIPRKVTIKMPFECTSFAQTCQGYGGKIVVNKTGAIQLPDSLILYKENTLDTIIANPKFTTSNTFEISPLAIGTYKLEASYKGADGSSYYRIQLKDTLHVVDSSFAISVYPKDAMEIGSNGSVGLKAKNVSDNTLIEWVNDGGIFKDLAWDSNDSVNIVATADTYKGCQASYGGCFYTLNDFVIDEPFIIPIKDEKQVGIEDITIEYDENDSNATIYTECKKGGNMSEFTLYLMDNANKKVLNIENKQLISETTEQGTVKLNDKFKYDCNDKYDLYVDYKAQNAIEFSTLCLTKQITPLSLSNCKAESAEGNKDRCYNTKGKINLSGECSFTINDSVLDSDDTTFETDINVNVVEMSKSDLIMDKYIIKQTVNRTTTIEIPEIPKPNVEFWVKDETCFEAGDGVIAIESAENIKKSSVNDLLLTLDKKTYASKLENMHANIEGNYYEVFIKDGDCLYSKFTTVKGPPSQLEIKLEGTVDPTCTNDNGSIEVSPIGGWGNYIFSIDDDGPNIPGEFAEFEKDKTFISAESSKKTHLFEGLGYGEHKVYVSDNKGCTVWDFFELIKYQNPYVSAATFDSVSCYGLSDGAVMVDSIHGTAPVNIYRLYESSGKEIDPITLTKKELENAASLYIADKAATIRDSIWTHESGDAIVKFENLPSANYYLCLTDTNNCATIVTPADEDRRFSIKVEQPDSLILFIDLEDTIIANYGMPGGEVKVHAEGGNKGRFLVSVDDTVYNTTNQNLSVTLKDIFLPGRHCIKAEDSKQCADTAYTGIMRQPDSRLRLTAQTVDALCKNKTGTITVAASGGWGVYQYSCPTVGANLGHGDLEYTFTGLYGGVYKVSVTDSARAVFDTTIIVNTPPELLAMPVPQDATCRDDGRIAVNLSGGVMPYRVFADFADTIYIDDTTYTSVAAFPGYYPSSEYAYEVYVMDSNDCTALAPVVITDSIPKASVKFANPSFHNVSNGNLTANVSKGTSPYSYLWTNRNTGATFTGGPSWKNISAGTYSLVVTDAHDCYANSGNQCDLCWFEYVPTAGDRELTIDTICNETGVGAQDGFVRIVSDTAGFSEVILYSCSSQSDMTEQASDKRQFELSGLSCGPYVLECRLPKGEVRYASFVIQEYKPLWLFVNNMRHVTTSGSENGRATVSIVDGASPYQAVIIKDSELYLDTIFESSKLNLDSLGAATYHVTVIDWYGKKRSIDFVINAPQAPLRLITDSVENVSCFSYDNGVVHLRAEGGWGDYQFAPVGGQYGNSTTFGNRVAGSYSFVAIDRLGVTDTLNVDVDQPERLSVGEPMVDSVTCFGDFDGSVKFNISGGNGGYVTYSDHGFSVHGDYVDNLNSDTYKFYFSDKKRCPSLDTLVVYVPQPDSLSIGETVRNTTCGESNGSIRINVTGGVKPYTYLWNDTTISKSDDQSVVYGLRQLGLYEVKVVDRNGCGVGKSFRIGASTKPRIARVSTLPIKCTGDSNGTAMLDSADLIPATPYAPFRIIWPNGQNQMAVNDLPAGRFSVTIADTNGCSSDFGFEIKSQSPLELQKLGSRDAHCYNYTDGAISVVAFGGAGNYSFLWNTGDTLSQISNIGMGSYTVVVTDANECRDTATYSISQPDSLYVDLGYDIYMCPENTYEFDPGAYATYEWKRNDTVLSTERVLTADGQGLYCIEVTDDAGCFSHDSVYVAVGIDLLKADFVMASDAPIDDTIALIELSNMEIDSLRWEFDNGVFETIDYSDYEIYLKPDTLGMHAITLWAYSGGCVSYQTKQIEIVEQADTTATANYGYNPLIKSILLKPNPNDGQFTVDIELREAHDIGATISNVGTGAQVAGFSRSGDSKYSENVDISNSGSGVYVLRVVAGDETRSVRFMITR